MFDETALILKLFLTFVKELNWSFFKFPKIKKANEIIINKIQTIVSFLVFLNINKAGTENKDIQIRLNE